MYGNLLFNKMQMATVFTWMKKNVFETTERENRMFALSTNKSRT
jgi:hypothetical protein